VVAVDSAQIWESLEHLVVVAATELLLVQRASHLMVLLAVLVVTTFHLTAQVVAVDQVLLVLMQQLRLPVMVALGRLQRSRALRQLVPVVVVVVLLVELLEREPTVVGTEQTTTQPQQALQPILDQVAVGAVMLAQPEELVEQAVPVS
jgi:hypothetical protein